jgi:hypothetical protein
MAKEAGIGFAPPNQSNETLIWVAGLLIGVPGLAQVLALILGGTSARTGEQPSSPALPHS